MKNILYYIIFFIIVIFSGCLEWIDIDISRSDMEDSIRNDCHLKNIKIIGYNQNTQESIDILLNPTFSPTDTSYDISLNKNVYKIDIIPEKLHSGGELKVEYIEEGKKNMKK